MALRRMNDREIALFLFGAVRAVQPFVRTLDDIVAVATDALYPKGEDARLPVTPSQQPSLDPVILRLHVDHAEGAHVWLTVHSAPAADDDKLFHNGKLVFDALVWRQLRGVLEAAGAEVEGFLDDAEALARLASAKSSQERSS